MKSDLHLWHRRRSRLCSDSDGEDDVEADGPDADAAAGPGAVGLMNRANDFELFERRVSLYKSRNHTCI